MKRKFTLGCRVKTTNGIPLEGVVIGPLVQAQYTDGSYRRPERQQLPKVVWVRWTDGTQGWTMQKFLEKLA